MACCDLGIAAVISFHRGETGAARGYLAAADPHAQRLGRRPIGPLTLARSLDREQDGALAEAQAALTDAFDGNEEVEEIEDLLADAVRLASADRRPGHRAGPRRPRRQPRRRIGPSRTGWPTRCTAAACWTVTAPGCWWPRNATAMPAGRC